MFRHIMIPVDVAGIDRLQAAIDVAADLARHYAARLTMVTVSPDLSPPAPESEDRTRLEALAAGVSERSGLPVAARVIFADDPSAELERVLLQDIERNGVDLVVIGSHQPGWTEYFVNSHGGHLASHAPVSVFVVRDPAQV